MASDVALSEPVVARDFDGLYKALLERYPREALHLLCGARLDGSADILDGPTDLPRQRNRQRDKVYVVRNGEDAPADIYHVEIQVKRDDNFQERMVYYWVGLALKYSRAEHRIHQVVMWPEGGGYPGRFSRDQVQMNYLSVSVPDDLDPDVLLAGPLALSARNPPPDVVERLVAHVKALGDLQEQVVQTELGMLAGGSLAVQFLDAMRRKGMNDVLAQTESGREIARRNLEQGLERGRIGSMRAILRAKYGDLADLDDLARQLTDSDHDGNLARIVAGATLAELRS